MVWPWKRRPINELDDDDQLISDTTIAQLPVPSSDRAFAWEERFGASATKKFGRQVPLLVVMPLPSTMSLDDVRLRIRQTSKTPNIGNVTDVVLKEGPQAYRIATLFEVLNLESGKLHHYYLRIDQVRRKNDGWHHVREKSLVISDDESKEVHKLYAFLAALYQDELIGKTGDVRVVPESAYATVEQLLRTIPGIADAEKLSVLKLALQHLGTEQISVSDLAAVFEASQPPALRHIAAASRMVEYTIAFEEMKRLVEEPSTGEREFQKHLENNPWMFGSEYSELLPRRTWTRDHELDYMLRRTVDDYLEIVEIKTAFSDPLFIHDASHDSYHPSS
ncbi:MAG TPA: hypothetical protein VL131_15035, partial [Gammaproteobacteria bacterium]|nr:hypothetical protein [Gammaproteobacteria bacterium]